MKQDLLSICIPVYNGEGVIRKSLSTILALPLGRRIPIIVSDNCSTDSTVSIVRSFQKTYNNISLLESAANNGLDKNVIKVLLSSKTKYSWLLGDDDYFTESALAQVFSACAFDYDMILLNSSSRIIGIPSGELSSGHDVIKKLGAHLTFMSTLIFRTSRIQFVDFYPFIGSLYLQTLLAYSIVANDASRVYWVADDSIHSFPSSGARWDIFPVFCEKLNGASELLPSYYTKLEREKFVRSHGRYILTYGLKSIFAYRYSGKLTAKWFFGHFSLYVKCFGYHRYFQTLFSFFVPVFLIRKMYKTLKKSE